MRSFLIGICLALSALVLTEGIATPAFRLEISGEEPDRVLVCLPVEAGATFYLEFVNSIYLAPVRETFVCEPAGNISIIRVDSPSAAVFEYYGLSPDGSGTTMLHRNVGGTIRLRSHDYQNHVFTVGERSIRLKGLVSDGEPLIIRVRTDGDCGP
jgi:hypothetical protein